MIEGYHRSFGWTSRINQHGRCNESVPWRNGDLPSIVTTGAKVRLVPRVESRAKVI
jgi:hypothetical protein